jgi:hypothetical protein
LSTKATVIYRYIPKWYGEDESFVRAELQRFLRRAGEEHFRDEIAVAPKERLLSLWYRLPYVRDAEELFSADWSLGLEPLSLCDLLRAGFGRPLRCGLHLELVHSARQYNRTALRNAVPWLVLLKDPEAAASTLLSRGWLLFRCSSADRAETLQRQVKPSQVRCLLLGCASGTP